LKTSSGPLSRLKTLFSCLKNVPQETLSSNLLRFELKNPVSKPVFGKQVADPSIFSEKPILNASFFHKKVLKTLHFLD
jgi:hypothetical protein